MKNLLNPSIALRDISATKLDRRVLLGIVVTWILYAGMMTLGAGKDILAIMRIALVEPLAHLSGEKLILVYKALAIDMVAFLLFIGGFYLIVFSLFNWLIIGLLHIFGKRITFRSLVNIFLYSYFFRRVLYVLALFIFFLQTRIFPTADPHLQLFDIAGMLMLIAQIGLYVYGIKILIQQENKNKKNYSK